MFRLFCVYLLTGKRNILGSAASDSRWMSFYDHAERWDRRWHLELMAHAYSWWQQGKAPWDFNDKSSDGSADSTFSHRVNAWCVCWPGLILFDFVTNSY